jgi:3-oxoacyl-[acyl-carrier-protein] synthase-3
MRFDPPLKIAAPELWLPDTREPVEDAVRSGKLEPERARENGYVKVGVSDLAPPQMAVLAGEAALRKAGVDRGDVGLLVHAWTYYQGQDYWEPVHYITNELALRGALPVGIQQGCNGGFAAVEVAACRMLADDTVRAAVITSAERFWPPGFDRWRANLNVIYGDSGTALVLNREHGPFELLSTAAVAHPQLESMYRGDTPWGTVPFQHAKTVDIRTPLRRFIAAGHGPWFAAISADAVLDTVRTALDLAGIAPDDPGIRVITPPRFGAELIEHSYTSVLAGLTKADILNMGRDTGHLGAGDMTANLADIARGRLLKQGQVALLLTATAGFTWSCMVVRAA